MTILLNQYQKLLKDKNSNFSEKKWVIFNNDVIYNDHVQSQYQKQTITFGFSVTYFRHCHSSANCKHSRKIKVKPL